VLAVAMLIIQLAGLLRVMLELGRESTPNARKKLLLEPESQKS
jgi:hypothetical protein